MHPRMYMRRYIHVYTPTDGKPVREVSLDYLGRRLRHLGRIPFPFLPFPFSPSLSPAASPFSSAASCPRVSSNFFCPTKMLEPPIHLDPATSSFTSFCEPPRKKIVFGVTNSESHAPKRKYIYINIYIYIYH